MANEAKETSSNTGVSAENELVKRKSPLTKIIFVVVGICVVAVCAFAQYRNSGSDREPSGLRRTNFRFCYEVPSAEDDVRAFRDLSKGGHTSRSKD